MRTRIFFRPKEMGSIRHDRVCCLSTSLHWSTLSWSQLPVLTRKARFNQTQQQAVSFDESALQTHAMLQRKFMIKRDSDSPKLHCSIAPKANDVAMCVILVHGPCYMYQSLGCKSLNPKPYCFQVSARVQQSLEVVARGSLECFVRDGW